MVYRLAVLFLISIQELSFAQIGSSRSDTDAIYNQLNRLHYNSSRLLNAEGTPFYSDKWETGNIIFRTGSVYKGVSLNIDLFSWEVHYLIDKTDIVTNSEKVKEVQILSSEHPGTYIVFRAGIPNTQSNTSRIFYNILLDGELTLMKLITKILKPKDDFGNNAAFNDSESLILFYKGSVVRIKSKNTITSLFPNQKREIMSFIKINKLELKNIEHMKSIVDYCNKRILGNTPL